MVRKTVACAAALAGTLALGGCAGKKTMYQWEGYQEQVHEYFTGDSKESQLEALEADLQKIKAKNGAVPPGYHAQLGLLYSSLGKQDQTVREFETEKALFPESATYMDFLLKNARGGAQ
ncbi:DUF4810 domain-containing protein [Pseudomonas sp. NY15437]|uniref:DUF4810 domain-containing protein n=1 Tax=Pseudomonas sp. NY15437 TaxID=3400360 RepID=UPI003A87689E